MDTRIVRLFTNHPASVDESYLQHFWFAVRFSGMLGAAAIAALVHSIFPFAFEKTASRIVATLYQRTHNRGG